MCVFVCLFFLCFFLFFRCLTFNGMLKLHVLDVIVCLSFPIYKHGKEGFPSGVSIFKRQYKLMNIYKYNLLPLTT